MTGRSSALRRHGWSGAPPPSRAAEIRRASASLPRPVIADTGLAGRLLGAAAARALAEGLARLRLWREVARQRRQLAELDDRLLKDIGLTRADVGAELSKPFWRI